MTCGDEAYPVQFRGKHGRLVRWDARGYEEHLTGRAREYLAHHEALASAVQDPVLEVQLEAGEWHYFGSPGLLPHPYAPLYLEVVVWWRNGIGEIATAWATKNVSRYVRNE